MLKIFRLPMLIKLLACDWLYIQLRKSPTFIASIVVNGFPQIYVIYFN